MSISWLIWKSSASSCSVKLRGSVLSRYESIEQPHVRLLLLSLQTARPVVFGSCVLTAFVKSEMIILLYCFCVLVNRLGEFQDPEKKPGEGA